MEPALSAEEWRDQEFFHSEYHGYRDGDTVTFGRYGISVRDGGGWYDPEHEIWIGRHHALAAACLHGQPFGFTWADVDALRESVAHHAGRRDDIRPINPTDAAKARADAARKWHHGLVCILEPLADRIAALLPPRNTK